LLVIVIKIISIKSVAIAKNILMYGKRQGSAHAEILEFYSTRSSPVPKLLT
jgi:hypothetical protein